MTNYIQHKIVKKIAINLENYVQNSFLEKMIGMVAAIFLDKVAHMYKIPIGMFSFHQLLKFCLRMNPAFVLIREFSTLRRSSEILAVLSQIKRLVLLTINVNGIIL